MRWQREYSIHFTFGLDAVFEHSSVVQNFLMSQHSVPVMLNDLIELVRNGVTRDIRTDRMRQAPAKSIFLGAVTGLTDGQSSRQSSDGVAFDVVARLLFKERMCFEIALLEGPMTSQDATQRAADGYTDVDCMVAEFKRHCWTCQHYEVDDREYGGIISKSRLIGSTLMFLSW